VACVFRLLLNLRKELLFDALLDLALIFTQMLVFRNAEVLILSKQLESMLAVQAELLIIFALLLAHQYVHHLMTRLVRQQVE
jgi:hypothetical protein